MTIGENIRRIRKEKGLTQKELGDLCNLADSAIRRYELGGANPKLETIEKIAKALNVKITDIVESLYWSEYEKTEEYKELENESSAYDGILSILQSIYGDVVKHEYDYELTDRSGYGVVYYYTVGKDENQFVLNEDDITTLLNYTKTSLPFIIDSLKDERPEQEIIKELCEKNEEILQKLIDGSIKSVRLLDEE